MAGSLKELSQYRFNRSLEELENAKAMFEIGKYKMSLNRSYYSVFHAIRAVNVLDEFDSSKHSGVIAHFNQFHVKEGTFPKETSKTIKSLSEMREHADYEDFFVASRQEAEEQLKKAERFLQLISDHLHTRGILKEK